MSPEFLTVADVLAIHAGQLELYGGESGVRDPGLLESAIAQPQASFGGEFLHVDLFEMAAAYLFHITKNHPFIDGNKRTGLVAALVFLDLNGVSVEGERSELYELTLQTALGRADKPRIAAELRRLFGKAGPA